MSTCGKPDCKCPMESPLEPGQHMLVAGQTGAGKTKFVHDFLIHKKSPFDAVLVFCAKCSANQPLYQSLKKRLGDKFLLKVGLPGDDDEVDQAMELLHSNHKKGFKTAVVVDDLILDQQKGKEGKFVKDLFLSGRHMNVSVINLSQAPSASDRFTRLQTSMFVLFRTALADGILALARQLHPESKGRRIMKMYRNSTRDNKHGYLMVDIRHGDARRFRDSSWNRGYETRL